VADFLLSPAPVLSASIEMNEALDHAGAWRRRIMLVRRGAIAAGLTVVALLIVVSVERPNSAASAEAAPVSRARLAGIAAKPHLVFRHTGVDTNYSALSLAALDAAGARDRAAAGLTCERVSFSRERGICLQADRGVFTTYNAVVFDRDFNPVRTIKLDGSPSRTRISPDGRVGTITVFVGKDLGYTSSTFSTRTILLDMASGELLTDLEQFSTWRNGSRFKAPDFNFWGVTFARDSNVFYASLRSQATTYLVRGDLALRKLTVLHENVECPSLSPDNRLIAYKKRVGPQPDAWRLYILDVATMAERPVAAETRFIDDQAEWLDDSHVLYGVPRPGTATTDAWVAPIDGAGPARVFLEEAESLIVVR
jgi:hypothetical protein